MAYVGSVMDVCRFIHSIESEDELVIIWGSGYLKLTQCWRYLCQRLSQMRSRAFLTRFPHQRSFVLDKHEPTILNDSNAARQLLGLVDVPS